MMELRYQGENLWRFAIDTKVGPGTVTRIKTQQTSVGIDVLEKIADEFKIQPWQLLAPGLKPSTVDPALLRLAEAIRSTGILEQSLVASPAPDAAVERAYYKSRKPVKK